MGRGSWDIYTPGQCLSAFLGPVDHQWSSIAHWPRYEIKQLIFRTQTTEENDAHWSPPITEHQICWYILLPVHFRVGLCRAWCLNWCVGDEVCRWWGVSMMRCVGDEVCRWWGVSVMRCVGDEVCRLWGVSVMRCVGDEVCRRWGVSVMRCVGDEVCHFAAPSAVSVRFGKHNELWHFFGRCNFENIPKSLGFLECMKWSQKLRLI